MLLYRVSLLLLLHGMSGLVKASDKNSGLLFESQLVPDVFKFYLSLSGFIVIACLLTQNVCMVVHVLKHYASWIRPTSLNGIK